MAMSSNPMNEHPLYPTISGLDKAIGDACKPFAFHIRESQVHVGARGELTISLELVRLFPAVAPGKTVSRPPMFRRGMREDIFPLFNPRKSVILTDLRDPCECGAHKACGTPRGPGHSSYCPWSQ